MKKIGLVALLLIVLGGGFFAVKKLGQPTSAQTVAAGTQQGTTVSEKTNTPSALATSSSGLTFTSVSGKTITINPNEKTVLHFMVSSCATCVATDERLTKFDHIAGVQIVSIDIDPQNDNLSTIQNYKKATGSSWPYVMDTNQSLVQKFHVTELDTIIVLYHNHVIFNQVAPSTSTLQKVLA